MKSALRSISVWISCIVVLLSLSGAADTAVACAGAPDQLDKLVTGSFERGLVLAEPSRSPVESAAAHHPTPLLVETSIESEFDESDQDDFSSLLASHDSSQAAVSRRIRARFFSASATTLGAPDSRGPPLA